MLQKTGTKFCHPICLFSSYRGSVLPLKEKCKIETVKQPPANAFFAVSCSSIFPLIPGPVIVVASLGYFQDVSINRNIGFPLVLPLPRLTSILPKTSWPADTGLPDDHQHGLVTCSFSGLYLVVVVVDAGGRSICTRYGPTNGGATLYIVVDIIINAASVNGAACICLHLWSVCTHSRLESQAQPKCHGSQKFCDQRTYFEQGDTATHSSILACRR